MTGILGLSVPLTPLQTAGTELRLAHLRAELEARLSVSWRGRLALRISRWWAAR